MIEDQNTGKFFKDAFDGYDSPFDADKMFTNIESEIEEEKKPKRRVGWYLFGCSGLLLMIGLSVGLTYYLNGDQKLTISEENSREYAAEVVEREAETKLTVAQQILEPKEIDKLSVLGDQNVDVNIAKEQDHTLTIDLERTEERAASLQSSTARTNENNLQNESNSDFDFVVSSTSEKTNEESVNIAAKQSEQKESDAESVLKEISKKLLEEDRISILVDYLQLNGLSRIPSKDQSLELTLLLPSKQQRLYAKKKWSIGAEIAYLWTNKTNAYNGDKNADWYKNFIASERLHTSYKVGLDVNYLITDHFYLTSSISYIHAQESHETTIVEAETSFDDKLAKIIYVDRDGDPLDTIFGVDFTRTTKFDYHLVTNIRLLGHGIGAGYSLAVTPRISLSTDAQFIYYLMQRTEGMMVNPDGLLIDNKALKLDGQLINLNRSVFAGQARLSIEYQLNDSFKVGISSVYRHHFGDFTDSQIFSQKRNYIGLGIRSSYCF